MPSGQRPEIGSRFLDMPSTTAALYTQINVAFRHRLDLSCAIGLRIMLDQLCNQFVPYSSEPSLWAKLEDLRYNTMLDDEGYRDRVTRLYRIGNKAVHELKRPGWYALEEAIESLNDILECLYFSHPDLTPFETNTLVGVASVPEAHRLSMTRDMQLPAHMDVLYQELIETFNRGLHILSLASIRAMLEGLCNDIGELRYTLVGEVEAIGRGFGRGGHYKDVVHVFELGNGALHRCETADWMEVSSAVFIVELVVGHFYGVGDA